MRNEIRMLSGASAALALVLLLGAAAAAQPVPRPFPRPGQPASPPDEAPPPTAAPLPPVTAPAAAAQEPTEDALGLPIYPGASFIASYDAGRTQRFYLFGTDIEFSAIVAYYRSVLRQRGHSVFDEPATHMFEVGRFREATMGFPPGVTVKDYTWGGLEGYLSLRPGQPPARFRTVIQIVPEPRP